MTSSMIARFRLSGTKPAPMPWMVWLPGFLPDSTAALAGSTATMVTPGFRSFKSSPTPLMVPPVPTPATKMSTAPAVSSQISTPVVSRWARVLAGFLNCSRSTMPGGRAAISRALSTASRMSEPGVKTTCAPRNLRRATRSRDMRSGMVRTRR